jgi:putative copper resistance protein D
VIDVALTVVRAVHFAAVLGLEGSIAFLFVVAGPVMPQRAARHELVIWSRWIAAALWGVAVLSGGAWLAVLAGQIGGTPVIDAFRQGIDWTLLTETQFGISWLWRAGIAGLLGLVLLFDEGRGCRRRVCASAAVALSIALTGSLAWSGHGAATPGRLGDLHLAADIVHLIASGLWLGALLPFAIVLQFAARGIIPPLGASEITRRFSSLATVSVALILLTGIVNSWVLVGSIAGLTSSLYGRLLLAKIGLFAMMLGFAAFNRIGLTPRLPNEVPRAARQLVINSCIELGLGIAVLAIVGVLGVLQPASHHHMTQSAGLSDDAAFVHIHGDDAMADVTVAPGRVGRATVIVRILRDDLSELPARSVDVTLVPPSSAAPAVSGDALHQPDGSWQIDGIDLPEAGNWTVKVFAATPATGSLPVLDAPIVIKDRR